MRKQAQVLGVEIRWPFHAQPCERMAAIASADSSGVASLEIFGIARLVISRVCLGVPSIRANQGLALFVDVIRARLCLGQTSVDQQRAI